MVLFASGHTTAVAEAEALVVALVEVSDTVDDTDEALEVDEGREEVEEDELTSFAPQMLGEAPAAPRTFLR